MPAPPRQRRRRSRPRRAPARRCRPAGATAGRVAEADGEWASWPRLASLSRHGTAPRARRPARAGRAHAGVVHAAGGSLAARVPRGPGAPLVLGGRAHAGAVRRGDAAAGAPARRGRGRDVRRHHDAGARDGPRRRARRRGRARSSQTRCERSPTSSGCGVPDPDEAFAPLLEAIADRARRACRPSRRSSASAAARSRSPATSSKASPSREFAIVKTLMYREPEVWRALLDKLADCFAGYVAAQVRAGADVVQLFDSWVGALSPADYERVRGAVVGPDPRRRRARRRSTSAPGPRRCCRRWRAPAAT